FGQSHLDNGRRSRGISFRDARQRGDRGNQSAFLIVCIQFERLGDEHRRASSWYAFPACKPQRGASQQEKPAYLSFCLTNDPKSLVVASNIKQGNRIAENCRVGTRRQARCV